MHVEVVSPGGRVWSGECQQVRVPASDGDMGILAGHTPVVALLTPGQVTVTDDSGADRSFDVTGGFVTVDDDVVSVLVDDLAVTD